MYFWRRNKINKPKSNKRYDYIFYQDVELAVENRGHGSHELFPVGSGGEIANRTAHFEPFSLPLLNPLIDLLLVARADMDRRTERRKLLHYGIPSDDESISLHCS